MLKWLMLIGFHHSMFLGDRPGTIPLLLTTTSLPRLYSTTYSSSTTVPGGEYAAAEVTTHHGNP